MSNFEIKIRNISNQKSLVLEIHHNEKIIGSHLVGEIDIHDDSDPIIFMDDFHELANLLYQIYNLGVKDGSRYEQLELNFSSK